MNRETLTNILLSILVIIALGAALKFLQPIVITVLIAILLAYVMDPLVAFLKKIRVPLLPNVLLTALLFICVFLVFGWSIYQSGMEFANRFPQYQAKFLAMLKDILASLPFDIGETIKNNVLDELKTIPIGSTIINAAGSVADFLTDFALVFLFSIFYLYSKYGFTRKIMRSFPGSRGRRIAIILYHIDVGLRKYIGVKAFISALVGLSTWIILLAFQVEFATLFGSLTFVLNFIPYIGSFIAVLIPPIMAMVQFGDLSRPIWVLISLLIVQNVIGQYVEPRLIGHRLKISVPFIFLALLFWGWLWGIAGVLLAVPMTTSIKIVMGNIPEYSSYAQLLEKAPKRRKQK